MNSLAESPKYQISSEYESVFLKIKETSQVIEIGDFYGDPQIVAISCDEKYCVMGGAGVIIYFLKEPFQEYQYNIQSEQWREWGRENSDKTIWVKNLVILENNHIEIETENAEKYVLNVLDNQSNIKKELNYE